MSIHGAQIIDQAIQVLESRIAYNDDIIRIMEQTGDEQARYEYFKEIAPSLVRLFEEKEEMDLDARFLRGIKLAKKNYDYLREDFLTFKDAYVNRKTDFTFQSKFSNRLEQPMGSSIMPSHFEIGLFLFVIIKSYHVIIHEKFSTVLNEMLSLRHKFSKKYKKQKSKQKKFEKDTLNVSGEMSALFDESDFYKSLETLLASHLEGHHKFFKSYNNNFCNNNCVGNSHQVGRELKMGMAYKIDVHMKEIFDLMVHIKKRAIDQNRELEREYRTLHLDLHRLTSWKPAHDETQRMTNPSYLLQYWTQHCRLEELYNECVRLKKLFTECISKHQQSESLAKKESEAQALKEANKVQPQLSQIEAPAVQDVSALVRSNSQGKPKCDDNSVDESSDTQDSQAPTKTVEGTHHDAISPHKSKGKEIEGKPVPVESHSDGLFPSSPLLFGKNLKENKESSKSVQKKKKFDETFIKKLTKHKEEFVTLFSKNVQKTFTCQQLDKLILIAGGSIDDSKAGSRKKITLNAQCSDMIWTVRETVHSTHAKNRKSEKHASSTTVKLYRSIFERAEITPKSLWPDSLDISCPTVELTPSKRKRGCI